MYLLFFHHVVARSADTFAMFSLAIIAVDVHSGCYAFLMNRATEREKKNLCFHIINITLIVYGLVGNDISYLPQ